jgi:hypothetical protein
MQDFSSEGGGMYLRACRTGKLSCLCLVCLFGIAILGPISAQQGKKYGTHYLKEYQAKNADETAILDILLQYEKAFNSHDLRKMVALFTNDGIYMPCGNNYIRYSIGSKDCQTVLQRNFSLFGFETYYDPHISVNGDKATINLLLETGTYLADYKFILRKADQHWLVLDAEYTNDRDK